MKAIHRKIFIFYKVAFLASIHFFLNPILLFFGIAFLGAGHGSPTLWYIAGTSCLLFNVTLFFTLACSFPLRKESKKWTYIFYGLLLFFLIYLGISIWAVTPQGMAAI